MRSPTLFDINWEESKILTNFSHLSLRLNEVLDPFASSYLTASYYIEYSKKAPTY